MSSKISYLHTVWLTFTCSAFLFVSQIPNHDNITEQLIFIYVTWNWKLVAAYILRSFVQGV